MNKELRRYQRLKEAKRNQVMALRREEEQIDLEIDQVRREYEEESRKSKVCRSPVLHMIYQA